MGTDTRENEMAGTTTNRIRRRADAAAILRKRYGSPAMEEFIREEKDRLDIGQQIYAARRERGLSQAKLAAMVGTTASAICRLESADYENHSLPTLRRIAHALGLRIEVRFIPDLAVEK